MPLEMFVSNDYICGKKNRANTIAGLRERLLAKPPLTHWISP